MWVGIADVIIVFDLVGNCFGLIVGMIDGEHVGI